MRVRVIGTSVCLLATRPLDRAHQADSELRQRYGELKLALAQQDHESADQYVAAKSPFLRIVVIQWV